MDIRLVATDLDGTLLNEHGIISERSLKALHECETRGIPVVMSSGRMFEGVRLLAKQAGLNSPIISSNGARVDASPFGPVWMEDTLPFPLAQQIFRILKDTGLYIECYSRNTIYQAHAELSPFLPSPKAYCPVEEIRDEDGYAQRFVNDLQRMEQEGLPHAYKLAAFSRDPVRLEEIRQALKGLPVNISSAFPYNMEIMAQGHGKGRAIRFLAEKLGLKIEQIMAFGDNTNDIEMLQAAGTGVAMGNAAPALFQAADMIAPTNAEDGEAVILEKWVLGKQ